MKLILASASPRRKEMMFSFATEEGFEIEIITADVDEHIDSEKYPFCGVEELAVRKGAAVAKEHTSLPVLSADTLVELDGAPLGKPTDKKEAEKMLRSLSGRGHNVHTGVALHYNGRIFSGVASTEVIFRRIEEAELYEYVESGEPMDKAGAYGIQGYAGRFVTSYNGDFDTVVGLSMSLVRRVLTEAGILSPRGGRDD